MKICDKKFEIKTKRDLLQVTKGKYLLLVFFSAVITTDNANTAFIKTDKTQPVIITNSLKTAGIVKCVCRSNKQRIKKRLQIKATLARNESQRMK